MGLGRKRLLEPFAHRLPQMMSALAIMAAAFEDMAPLLRERLEQALPADTH